MAKLKRIDRMIRHYQRLTDEHAVELAEAQAHLLLARSVVVALQTDLEGVNAALAIGPDGNVDVNMAIVTQAYRERVKSAIEGGRSEVTRAESVFDERREHVTAAMRAKKTWENLKERTVEAEQDYQRRVEQSDMDERAVQNRYRDLSSRTAGTNRRTDG